MTWEADARLTDNPYWSSDPSIAVVGTNIHVVWFDDRDWSTYEIYHKRSTDNGSTWETDEQLTYNSFSSLNTSVASFGTYVHVVWYDTRDGNEEIYYKRNPTGSVDVKIFPTHEINSQILIAPSIFKDKIIIQLSKDLPMPLKVNLYSIYGNLIIAKDYFCASTSLIIQDKKIQKIPKGVYFLKVYAGKKELKGVKLIKLM